MVADEHGTVFAAAFVDVTRHIGLDRIVVGSLEDALPLLVATVSSVDRRGDDSADGFAVVGSENKSVFEAVTAAGGVGAWYVGATEVGNVLANVPPPKAVEPTSSVAIPLLSSAEDA